MKPPKPDHQRQSEIFDKRLDKLESMIDKHRLSQPKLPSRQSLTTGSDRQSGWRLASQCSAEMIGCMVVSVAIGYGLDNGLDCAPLFLIIFFFLGAGAGIYNVWKLTTVAFGGANSSDPDQG